MDISIEALKRACGRAAAERVEDGMTLGLGTGSTVKHALIRLAERIREDDLSIVGVATSQMTIDLSQELGIPLIDLPPTGRLDLCIDGADEISPDGNLIKGGGGWCCCGHPT